MKKMNRNLSTILGLLLSIHLSAQQFINPVIPGDFADPTVIRVGDKYYASGTSSEWAPHYPVYESVDLVNWNYVGPAFQTMPEWTKGSFWAPEFYVLNGKIYLYYTARRASDGVSYIGVAVTDDIKKGFRDYGCLVEYGTEAIDAFVFEDKGKLYISWKAYGLDKRPIELLCSELSPDGFKLIGEPFMLLRDNDNIGMEGQYIFKKGDYYYILYSIRGCCGARSNYAVSVARSKSFRGPYEYCDGNPILQGDGNDILSCGHGTVVETPEGKMLYLYHAYMKGPGFYNGRQAFLKELAINEKGWPYFVTGNYASVNEAFYKANIKQAEIPDFEDRFDNNKIRPEWTWNFTFSDISTKVENKSLLLTGAPKTENKYGTALCLRTLKPDYEINTEVKDKEEIFSGLTLYGDKDNLIIFGKENGALVLKQVRKGEEQVLLTKQVKGNVHLKIVVSDGCNASYYWSTGQKKPDSFQPVIKDHDVSYLPPWDRAFRPGLIHIGKENIPAEFSYCTLNYKEMGERPDVDPLELSFQRLAVRRFIFSNNIKLNEFVPAEIVSFESMHPAFAVSESDGSEVYKDFKSLIEKGRLVLNAGCGDAPVSIYIGGVNPYATYEVDIESHRVKGGAPVEVGVELARLGLRDKVQVVSRLSDKKGDILLRVYRNNEKDKEYNIGNFATEGSFTMRVQLYGRTLGVFITQNGETRYIGHLPVKEHFGDVIDFRNIKTSGESTFNLISNLKGEVLIKGARSYLSSGIGQADIRLISNEDLSPFIDDGRLWFTFSCRGLDTPQSVQGVLSLDPSVFDIRFEGMIVFDHGDGLIRNDYASHLFYDRNDRVWKAYVCDFGGSANKEGRTNPGLITASSPKDPRKGFSVMKASLVSADFIEGHNEDPCIFYDKNEKKWRLLTSAFVDGNITSRTFESDQWNGKFTPLAMPIKTNSTGTSIQRIGGKHYALMGGHDNLRIHSYPDLTEIGELKLQLQPHWPKPAGRIWASVVPLPEGYPYRYILLTMDRPNFPGVKGSNWSYGALYFYGANPNDISSEKYEY